MSFRQYQIALAGIALAAAAGPAEIEQSAKPASVKKNANSGNPSGHMPHQGKREMERRRKRMEKGKREVC